MCTRQGSPVMIEDDRTGYHYPASLHTRGGDCGMYLESNYAPRPGSTLHLHFTPESLLPPRACRAVIQWRKRLHRADTSWSYALGIKSAGQEI
jgi:hypothetical protein